MKERTDWPEAGDLPSPNALVDCDPTAAETAAAAQKSLSDIVLFCKSPQNYCAQKGIFPAPDFLAKPGLVSEEEDSLAKSVFHDARVEDLESPDPASGLTAVHYAAYFGKSSHHNSCRDGLSSSRHCR